MIVNETDYPRKWDRKRDRHVTRRWQKPEKPFVGWDSEGYTDDYGVHHMMLYGCSEGDYVLGSDVSGHECFRLMLEVAKRKPAIHVIFAGGYDVVMMIRNYPPKVAERIMRGEPTWWEGYRHEFFKGKWFRVSDGTTSITLYDVFTFFSTSFVKACREYLGNNPDFDRIEQTKLLRDKFTIDDVESLVVPYWRKELHYLVELCTILRTRLKDADIVPTQWHGPGAVAGAVLKARGIKAHMADTPPGVREASRYAYFGGRFEQFRIGYERAQCYQYDIRSAYPFAITRLPSLAGIRWVNKQKRKGTFNEYGIYRIRYDGHEDTRLITPGPLPWRSANGNIYYPHDIADGWYWGIELQAAQELSKGTITVLDAWEPATYPTNYPFTFVQQMYDDRAKMKREGNPTQLALKLAMNSLYGKLAQSKGAKLNEDGSWRIPSYHQLEWAGWITAATRAKLYRAMVEAGSDLIAVETDALYTTKPLNLSVSERLGDWEKEELDGIMYVQSGVYFKQKGGKWTLKSRGFEPRNHTFESWYSVFEKLPADKDATVTVTVRRFGSVPTSKNWATWYEMSRTSEILQKSSKRVHLEGLCYWCDFGESLAAMTHPLIVPQFILNCDIIGSKPHALPWINPEDMPPENTEFVITEEEFAEMGFL